MITNTSKNKAVLSHSLIQPGECMKRVGNKFGLFKHVFFRYQEYRD